MGALKKLITYKEYTREHIKLSDEEEIQRDIMRKENEENMRMYVEFMYSIMHNDYVPIKFAINQYREQLNSFWQKGDIGNSDRWVLSSIMYLSKILLITKKKNKWVCSKQRLDNFDFNKYDICELGNLDCVNVE